MVSPLSPDNVKGWLGIALSVVERATPITLLFILLIGSLTSYYLLKELGRTRTINYELWQRLLAAEKQTVDMAWRCSQAPAHETREGR